MKSDPVQTALAQLDAATPEQLAKALVSKWNVVAAKAARLAGEQRLTELIPQLSAAMTRLLPEGAAKDKGCAAKTAIARALVSLEHDDADLFRRGMRHVQMEAAWLRPEDTAAELRATCAIGLANTRDTGRLRDLIELLIDREWQARAGAARAIAAVGGEPAILILRYKALIGDEHDDVQYECFSGLIELEGAEALAMIRRIATEPAILALGASRRPDAVVLLQEFYEQAHDPARIACISLALSSSRLDQAIEFLLEQLRTGCADRSRAAKQAMSIHRHDPGITARVEAVLRSRE